MRTRERKRPDRRWVPWSAAGTRLPTVQLQAHVEGLEARNLLSSPHFISATAALDAAHNAVVSWKESGLGDNVSITYKASANVTATFECVNNGGNVPTSKVTVSGPVTATGTFSSGKNGSIDASLTLLAPTSSLTCPPGQHMEEQITYTNIAITDTTNGITQSTTPSSLSFTSSGFIPV